MTNLKTLDTLELPKIIQLLKEETVTSMTKEICDDLHPSLNYSEIENWLTETSEARELLSERDLSLRGLHDVRKQLQLASKDGMLDASDLIKLSQLLGVSNRVRKALDDDFNEKYSIISSLIKKLPDLEFLRKQLDNHIDENGEIKDNATPKLRQLRSKIKQLRSQLKSSVNKIVNSNAKYLQDQIVTMRYDRYVIPVKAEYQNSVPGIIHDQSSSGMTVYIEPQEVVEKNNELRQVKQEEKKEVERILYELSQEIKVNNEQLQDCLQILVELDFILAKGSLSRRLQARAAELIDEPRLNIIKGRHPLLGDEAVPVTVELGNDFNTMVITGPNTGGKTVTLKMVGLFTLMTQMGLHIPASRGTEMGIFDNVFADIGDEQDIEQSLSTFSSHMSNIVNIVEQAGDGSLVLLDELGAGTDPTEGSALAMSLLEYFHSIGSRSIATTHFTQLKSFAHSREGVENASVEFDESTLEPTYTLLIGIPGKSNAFVISRRLGLREQIVANAKNFLAEEDIEVEELITSLTEKERSSQKLQKELERERAKIEKLKSEIDWEKQRMEQKKEDILLKARQQAEEIIADAKRDAEESLKEARKMAEKKSQNEMAEVSSRVRERLSNRQQQLKEELREASDHEPISPQKMKPGLKVYLSSLDNEGQILSLDKNKEQAEVQVGIMKVTVSFSDIFPVKSEGEDNKTGVIASSGSTRGKKVFTDKKQSISTELDIRGERVDDALNYVDKYLDDAVVTGLNQVTIIHGKGTGNLRKAIHFHLEGHTLVSEYRIGNRQEGGEGVTVIKLNQ